MLDTTGKKLLRLLESDHPAVVRAAAALVVGELGVRDEELGELLIGAADGDDPALRAEALVAIGKLKIDKALPCLLAHVQRGGDEAEKAAHAAARLGAKGTRALQELMPKVAPGLRRRIVAALGAGGTTSAETAALDALLDRDPGVVDAAVRSLIKEVPTLTESHRRAQATHILELLDTSDGPKLSAASQTALVRLLAALGDPRGEPVFWSRVDPGNAAEVRAAALLALGAPAEPPAKDRLKRLLVCAADRDFRVAAPALMMLRGVPVARAGVKDWLPLLDAPDVASRRFALEKVGDLDTPELAEALLRQLSFRDRALRDEALARLTAKKHGREALAKALLNAPAAEDAWTLARAQAPFIKEYPEALRQEVYQEACTRVEAGDRRADALVFLLREADARGLRDQLDERAAALVKKKDYATALTYLKLLARDPACAEATRFTLAACGLKVSGKDLAAESRAADPCLAQFARLLNNFETDPLERLRETRWLDPEDLFYLGFHFVELERREKEFGGSVLQLMIQRAPRVKLARDAKSKLRSAGLA